MKCEPRLVVGVGDEPVEVFVGAIVHLFGIHQPDGPEVVGLGPVELDAAADEAAVLLHDLLHLGLVGVLYRMKGRTLEMEPLVMFEVERPQVANAMKLLQPLYL